MFEKKMRLDALYEFYGKMLTDKQSEIMNLYCNLDYSLGEISEILGVSRQAVHDTIKRTEKSLENYEAQLALYERFRNKQIIFENLYELIIKFEKTGNHDLIDQIKNVIRTEME
jgi:predicted DNA-binding protein YlxM (UPF0122 family)